MKSHIERGIFRVIVVIGALWIVGMGWAQYQNAQHAVDNSLTISLSGDKQLRIDANGIEQSRPSDERMRRLIIVFLPPALLLLTLPLIGWLSRGFKKEG